MGRAVKLVILVCGIAQVGMMFKYSNEYKTVVGSKVKEIVENSTKEMEYNIGLKFIEGKGIEGLAYYDKEKTGEYNINNLYDKKIISKSVKSLSMKNRYDGLKQFESNVYLYFNEFDENIVDDVYNATKYIKYKGKEIVTRAMIEESYKNTINNKVTDDFKVDGTELEIEIQFRKKDMAAAIEVKFKDSYKPRSNQDLY